VPWYSRMSAREPAAASNWAASFAVLAAWSAAWVAAIAIVYRNSTGPTVMIALTSATVLLVAAVVGGAAGGVPRRSVLPVGVAMGVAALFLQPPLSYVHATKWLIPGVVLGAIALLGTRELLVPMDVRARRAAVLVLLLTSGSYTVIIFGGVPDIDVWTSLRGAARGLLAGRNPYELSFPDAPPGETSDCFNYLPGTFLLASPGEWLFGDARWAEMACLVAAISLLVWHVGQRSGWTDRGPIALAALVGVVPGTLLVVQQAWTEPLLLLAVVAAAVLMDRGRTSWAAAPLGLALATKQHMLVLLPLIALWPQFHLRRFVTTAAIAGAVTLPWYLANPARFMGCTRDFFFGRPALSMSLSLWLNIPEPARLPVLVLALSILMIVVMVHCPRTGAGFMLGSGVLLSAFSLLNKQSFVNQWWFGSVLVIAGIAATVVPRRAGSDEFEPLVGRSGAGREHGGLPLPRLGSAPSTSPE
jgi:hypothetical protein